MNPPRTTKTSTPPANIPATPATSPDRSLADALARCVGDVTSFEATHWGRSPFVRRNATGEVFEDVWSIAAHDEFLAGGLRRPLIRLVRDGASVPGDLYTTRARLGGTEFRDVIDPDRVAHEFVKGATVVAQSIHRTHADVRAFTEQLADEIAHPVQANSYLTPPNATGLAPHADRHDVLVLQIEGSKRWRVDGLDEFELHAGDTVYIPAGTQHSATSTQHTSLHLTIGILSVTYRSVLRRLLADGPNVLDEPLPLRGQPGVLSAGVQQLLDEVVAHLDSVEASEVAAAEAARPIKRPPRAGALSAAKALLELSPATMIKRSAAPWQVVERADRVRVESGSRHLSAPMSCRPAVDQIAQGAPLEVGSLVGLDEPSRVLIARRLIEAELCETIDVGEGW